MRGPKVAAWALHRLQLNAARTFIEACAAEGVDALPVKGIVTAFTLYDDPIERRLRDVDVRIPWARYGHLHSIAASRGWKILDHSRAYRNVVFLVDGVDVDVEASIGPPHFCSLPVEAMIARANRSTLLGFLALLPAPLDHAVLLVVNAFKDKMVLAQPEAIEDLDRLTRQSWFEPTTLASSLGAYDLVTVGWYVAGWMARERKNARWQAVQECLTPKLRRRHYVEHVERLNASAPSGIRSRILTRAASDRFRARAMTLATTAWWQLEEWAGRHRPA